MSYDFPDSPTEDQEYVPPVGGQTYVYKAPRWLVKGIPPSSAGGGGGGIAEAPVDGAQYARQNAAWTTILIPAGDWDSITGKPITFPPTVPIAWTDVSGKPLTYPPALPIAQTGITNLVSDQAAQDTAIGLKAPLANPTFTGDPKAPTPATADSDTSIATTAFTHAAIAADITGKLDVSVAASTYAPLANPTFTGDPKAPTPATSDNDTSIATTAYVKANMATIIGGATISDTAPGTPAVGQFWFESDTGILFVYYNDGNSSQWVPATVGTAGPAGPPGDISLAVAKAGDTMTGDLTIGKATPSLIMDKAASGQACVLAGRKGGLARWDMHFGNATAESGSSVGSDLALNRYDDLGAYIDSPLIIARNTGRATVNGDPTVALGIVTKQYVDARATAYLQNSVVFDPPSQATNVVGAIQTLTVTGAAVGDFCLASFSNDLNGMTLLAWVSAANTTKFQFQNKTAGTIDLASGTVRVRVWKQ